MMFRIFVLVLLGFSNPANAQNFSCRLGTRPACLDYGDKICSPLGKCVSQSAACFDEFQCGYEGFTCKSNVTELQEKYNSLARDYDDLVDRFNALLENSNDTRDKLLSLARDYDELVDEHNALIEDRNELAAERNEMTENLEAANTSLAEQIAENIVLADCVQSAFTLKQAKACE